MAVQQEILDEVDRLIVDSYNPQQIAAAILASGGLH